MKKILYIFITIIILWLIIFVIDFGLSNMKHKPIFSWKQIHYVDGEDHVTEYYGLGYKIVEYSKGWIQEYKLAFINTSVIKSDFVILDDSESCKNSNYYFYEDVNFKYYFDCQKQVSLMFKDGQILKIEDALKNDKVTIEELEEAELFFKKESKIMFTFEISKDNTCKFLEADNSKLTKVSNDLSYYCLNKVNIYVNKNYYTFKDAYNNVINLENILFELDKEVVYESGAVMYGNNSYRMLVCSNGHAVLGPAEMQYFDIFCNVS